MHDSPPGSQEWGDVGRLFENELSGLWKHARNGSRTGDREILDEIVQEAIVKFLERFSCGEFEGHVELREPLIRCVYNEARNWQRRSLKRLNHDELKPGHQDPRVPAHERRPDTLHEQKLVAVRLRTAESRLSMEHRQVVAAHKDGTSFRELAERTGLPASTLKSRFRAALCALRAQLRSLTQSPDEGAAK